MKRIALFAIVLIGLLIMPFAALADAPVAEPPPGAEVPPSAEPPAPPAIEDGPTCYLPAFVYEDGECTIFLKGDLSASEIAALLIAASADDPFIAALLDAISANDSFLGTAPIELAGILNYLRVHTPNIPGIGPLTAIQVGATCRAFVTAERLDDDAYYTCYAILSRAAGNLHEVLCPALSDLITLWTGRAGTPASKKMLESAQTAHNAFCFGKTVSVGGVKTLAMRVQTELPAEPPPGAELPTPEPPAPVADEPLPDYCPAVVFTYEDGECVFLLTGDLSTSEVVALTRAAHDANPFLGAGDLETIMQYLSTTTDTVFGVAVETRILVGKTCRDLADGLGGDFVTRGGHYANCVEALRKVYGNFKALGCPALRAFIARMFQLQSAGTITAGQARALASAVAAEGQLCANV